VGISVTVHVEGNFLFSLGLCLSDASDEMNENIHSVRLPEQANLQLEIEYKKHTKKRTKQIRSRKGVKTETKNLLK
jgi:hypothetical protein